MSEQAPTQFALGPGRVAQQDANRTRQKTFIGTLGMPSMKRLAEVDSEISRIAPIGYKPNMALEPDLIAHLSKRVRAREAYKANKVSIDWSHIPLECPSNPGMTTSTQTSYRLITAKEDEQEATIAGLWAKKRISDASQEALVHTPRWRVRGQEVIHGVCFQTITVILILGNSLVIGLETDITNFEYWDTIETAFLFSFLGELLTKTIFFGVYDLFNRDNPDVNWNIFDALIVTLGLVDFIVGLLSTSNGGSFATLFRIIRLLRVLRIIRVVKFFKHLYLLAAGLAEAVQAIFWLTILMTFILYVCSIILVRTIGRPPDTDPNHDFLHRNFGGVLPSMLSMFVLMSSPNLPVYQDQVGLLEERPFLTIFLVCFILFGSFGMLALLTGVIGESMFERNKMRTEEERIEHEKLRLDVGLRCEELYNRFDKNDYGEVSSDELKEDEAVYDMAKAFESCGVFVTGHDLCTMIDYFDSDGRGTISKGEFMRGMMVLAEGLRPISVQEVQQDVGVCRVKIERIEAAVESMVTALYGEDSSLPGRTASLHCQAPKAHSSSHNLLENISKHIQELEKVQKEACHNFQDLSGQVREISRQVQTLLAQDIASLKTTLSTSFRELSQIPRQGQDIASLKALLSTSCQELGQISRQVQSHVIEDIASLKAYVTSSFQELGQHITQECERSYTSLIWSDSRFVAPLDPSYPPSSYSATGSPADQVEEESSKATHQFDQPEASSTSQHTEAQCSPTVARMTESSVVAPMAHPQRNWQADDAGDSVTQNAHGSEAAGQVVEVVVRQQLLETVQQGFQTEHQKESSRQQSGLSHQPLGSCEEVPQKAQSKPPAPMPSSSQLGLPATAAQAASSPQAQKLPPLPKSPTAVDRRAQSSEGKHAAQAQAECTAKVLKDLHVLQALQSLQSQTQRPLSSSSPSSASAPTAEARRHSSTPRDDA